MSDQITVDELKIFVGTGLEMEVNRDTWAFEGLDTSEKSESAILSKSDFAGRAIGMYATLDSGLQPIVRPWIHLTKEIEVDGERFVPADMIYGHRRWEGTNICENTKTMVLGNSFGLDRIMRLAAYNFDIFDWLSRTDSDGRPLAVEMK